MVLSDKRILTLFRVNNILENIEDPNKAVQPASLDLHSSGDLTYLDGCPYEVHQMSMFNDKMIQPSEIVLVDTIEKIFLPDNLAAAIVGVSSNIRSGVLAPIGGFSWVDPGYRGTLTIVVQNQGIEQFNIGKGERIAQLIFFPLTEAAERPYGSHLRQNHYQDSEGPTGPRG